MTTFSLSGLVRGGRVGPQVLGHQGPRLVVDRSDVTSQLDESTGLYVCPLDQIFVRPESPIIVFGTPNVALVMPNDERTGWDRFAAFMFWRQKSFVARTKGRVQAGVLFELLDLPTTAIVALNDAIRTLVGTRKASCAHSVALALHGAGFTSGGRTLKRIYRPTRLASILWRGGLEYQGKPVQVRPIQTRQSVADHFVSVWRRELNSLVRLYQKYISRSAPHGAAPVFDPAAESVEVTNDLWAGDGPRISVGVSIPSNLGVNLGYVLGEQPEFVVRLPSPLEAPCLQEPLPPFPGELDFATKLKKRVLFSRPVVWFMRHHLVSRVEWIREVPLEAVPQMLRRSPGPDHATAFVYNLVITRTEVRLKRLRNDNGRDQKFVNWMLAKHVLLSGYSPDVVLPGEVWCYMDGDDLVVCLSGNSGTYKPDEARVRAAVAPLSTMFGVRVVMVGF
jgi:hypothetical protein